METKTKSSIDQLIEKLKHETVDGRNSINFNHGLELAIEYAKALKSLHRKEIEDAHNDGFADSRTDEEYYNQTFEQ